MNKAVVWVALLATVVTLTGCGAKKDATLNAQDATNPTENVNENNAVAKVGDTVKVDYVGTLDDGSIFDTSIPEKAKEGGVFDEARPYEPLTVGLGKGEVIPGFEKAIEGMKVGETKTITLTAEEAYGQPREELVQKVPVDTFSGSDIQPEVGKTYNFGVAQGTIKEVGATEITIDFNHPLAGKALTFEITVKEIMAGAAVVEPTVEEVQNTEPTDATAPASTGTTEPSAEPTVEAQPAAEPTQEPAAAQ